MSVYRRRQKTPAYRASRRKEEKIMRTKRERKRIPRELPPVGTTLTATYRGQSHTAEIVEAKDRPAGRAVKYGDQLFASLSAAAKAVTGHSANGWVFWRAAEKGQE
jgi:hypothetical protein